MKALLLVLLLLSSLSADPLEPWLWKNRLLLVQGADQSIRELLSKELANLKERDLIVLNLSSQGPAMPQQVALTAQEKEALRKRFQTASSEKAIFILVGKDGTEKARQTSRLSLAQFFALIDTMPMRKAEIKKESSK